MIEKLKTVGIVVGRLLLIGLAVVGGGAFFMGLIMWGSAP